MLDDQNCAFLALMPGPLGKNDPNRKGNDKPLRTGGKPYSGNIFYYWFRFLQLHMRYVGIPKGRSEAKVTEVYGDFDVTETVGFWSWWNGRGRWQLAPMQEQDSRAHGIVTKEEFAQLRDGISIFFPFDGDLPAMLRTAEEQFKIARSAFYAIRPELRAKYALFGKRYELEALHNKLIVYPAVMDAPRDEPFVAVFDRISDQLELGTLGVPFEDWHASNGFASTRPRLGKDMTPDQVNKFMSDNFDGACRLVYHVARGQFPKFAKPEGPYNPRKPAGSGY